MTSSRNIGCQGHPSESENSFGDGNRFAARKWTVWGGQFQERTQAMSIKQGEGYNISGTVSQPSLRPAKWYSQRVSSHGTFPKQSTSSHGVNKPPKGAYSTLPLTSVHLQWGGGGGLGGLSFLKPPPGCGCKWKPCGLAHLIPQIPKFCLG